MAEINHDRMTVRGDTDVVVFLIGSRINKWWRIDKWLPVALAMNRMMKELAAKPESGFLGYAGGGTMMVQYWKSLEHLMRYASDREGEHFPAWVHFRKTISESEVVGIWHETYFVPKGSYECVYQHMPPFGLGSIFELVPATGHLHDARKRLAAHASALGGDRAA
jgi:hypothetical protein